MECHDTDKLTQLALECNPESIASLLEREIEKAKSEGDDPACVSFCLLDIRPYNIDIRTEIGIVEGSGYCSQNILKNDNDEFRNTLFDLIKKNIMDKSIFIDIVCSYTMLPKDQIRSSEDGYNPCEQTILPWCRKLDSKLKGVVYHYIPNGQNSIISCHIIAQRYENEPNGYYESLKIKIRLVTELLGIKSLQSFYLFVRKNEKLMDGIMRFSVSDYRNWIQKTNILHRTAKRYERAKYYNQIFGLTREEFLDKFCMMREDMYYR